MKEIILVKYGEIILKGGNRANFERILIRNIKNAMKNVAEIKVTVMQATIYIETDEIELVCQRLEKIFGIVAIVRAAVCEKDIADISKKAVEYCAKDLPSGTKFKVEAKRSDKKFPYNSIEISQMVGGELFQKCGGIVCDVHNPEVTVRVEIRDFAAYVYSNKNKIDGQGGMPIGSGEKATLLLSGGIDSPVAGYMMSKRGIQIDAVNFFSYPYTSERAKEKVIELALLIAQYTSKMTLYIVPFTDIQLAIRDNCPEEQMTLIMRRYMMRIAEAIAEKKGSVALVTGESAGQVASQTLSALAVTNDVCTMPVLRPLIGMDKKEIIEISKKIGTFETSILPYEDCCTVFTPKHPTTKPKLENIRKSEAKTNMEELIAAALAGVERIDIYPER